MSSFGEAFKKARKKFMSSGKDSDYVFTWNGKRYNILQKGETKAGVMAKANKNKPTKSDRPSERPGSKRDMPKASDRPKARDLSKPAMKDGKPTPTAKSLSKATSANEGPAKPVAGPIGGTQPTAGQRPLPKRPGSSKVRRDARQEAKPRPKTAGSRARKETRMAKGGLVKSGHTDRKGGMFYKTGSPKGYK